MATPATLKDIKKPKKVSEPDAASETAKKPNIRPHVAKLIKKVIDENAPTWKELAKR